MDLALACLWATDPDRYMRKVKDEDAEKRYGRETWDGGREVEMKNLLETPQVQLTNGTRSNSFD